MRAQLPLALLLASTTVACTTENSIPENESEIVDALELENGGFDTSDEAPMFALEAQFEEADLETDRPVVDSMRDDAEMRALEAVPGNRRIDIVVMWGRFRADATVPTRRDWSGRLLMSGINAVAAHRAIGFEDATDRVLPRQFRNAIAFESATGPRTDGLALRIVDTRGPNSTDPLTLTYHRANSQEAYALDIDSIVGGNVVVVDAGDGNQIVAMARPHRDDCDDGFFRGRWHAVSPRVSTFLGAVLNSEGEIVGHMRGISGTRLGGEPVIFGKWVNREGQYRGMFRGQVEAGQFRAKLVDRAGNTEGEIAGAFRAGDTLRHGGLAGRWHETACVQQPDPSIPPRP